MGKNLIKTIDKAFHQNDYQRLKEDLQANRAQTRLLSKEIEDLEAVYNSVKNSPQGPALKMELENKKRILQTAKDKLTMYKDLGRNGLGIDPEEYKLQKAENQGMIQGGIGGLALGGVGGLALGNMMNESTEIEEASKTFNPAYSKPLSRGLQKVSNVLPEKLGGGFANRMSAGIDRNRQELGAAIKQKRKEASNLMSSDPGEAALHRADAAAMSKISNPAAVRDDHPDFQKLKKGNLLQPAMDENGIDNLIKLRGEGGLNQYTDEHGNVKYRKGNGFSNPILSSDRGSIGDKATSWAGRQLNKTGEYIKNKAESFPYEGHLDQAHNFIQNTAVPKAKDYLNRAQIKANQVKDQYNNLNPQTQNYLKLGGGLLGAGSLAALGLMGGEDAEVPEVPEVSEVIPPQPDTWAPIMDKINQVPGGIKTVAGVPAALAAGYGIKKLADRYKR